MDLSRVQLARADASSCDSGSGSPVCRPRSSRLPLGACRKVLAGPCSGRAGHCQVGSRVDPAMTDSTVRGPAREGFRDRSGPDRRDSQRPLKRLISTPFEHSSSRTMTSCSVPGNIDCLSTGAGLPTSASTSSARARASPPQAREHQRESPSAGMNRRCK